MLYSCDEKHPVVSLRDVSPFFDSSTKRPGLRSSPHKPGFPFIGVPERLRQLTDSVQSLITTSTVFSGTADHIHALNGGVIVRVW